MKILIADDDLAFRQVLSDVLHSWGYEVVEAGNGEDAWRLLQADRSLQLAVLDWEMPPPDGKELCQKVREAAGGRYVYLILLTSHQRDGDIVDGLEAGADDYLTKPLKVGELQGRLRAGVRVVELENDLVAAWEAAAVHALELEIANNDLESFAGTVGNSLLKSLLSIGDHAKAIEELHCRENRECTTHTRRIYDNTKQLAMQVGLMHDYFRPARVELRPETLDLSALAREFLATMQRREPQRRLLVRVTEGITALGDRRLMQKALDQLLLNAWQHTGLRETAAIEFGLTEIGGEQAYFVRDNGVGFDPAAADTLFQPFAQLPGSARFAGHGIGLATVQRTIRRHGGRVWAEGVPGEGATFYFTLPG
jgi:DNA-binding response OmpR family regulator